VIKSKTDSNTTKHSDEYNETIQDLEYENNTNRKVSSVLKKPEIGSENKIYVKNFARDRTIEIERVKREANVELKKVIFYEANFKNSIFKNISYTILGSKSI